MLVAQAVYAAEYFLDRKFEDAPAEIRRITAALRRDTLNIALIGMPSSGKTTLGKLLAKQLGRTFVDLDDAIVKADGRSTRTSLPPRARTASVQKRPSRPPASARRTASCCPAAAAW